MQIYDLKFYTILTKHIVTLDIYKPIYTQLPSIYIYV